jgi:hypothetical protein
MSIPGRLARYQERLLSALRAYRELQGKIAESIRTGASDALAVQASLDRSAAAELVELERAIRSLRAGTGAAAGDALAELELRTELERRVERERSAALEANHRNREQLSGALGELRRQLQELQAQPRPHSPSSPFTRIGRPTLVDLHS